jgi:hypothetical protein
MRKKTIWSLIMAFVWMSFAPDVFAVEDSLCTPNPSKEAVALYRFLYDIKGDKMLSGQMYAPWGINELQYLQTVTGKQPAVMGVDFIHQSANATEVQNAINWWNAGGIPTIMWHWGAPGVGEGYENSKVEINIDNCFVPGTKEYNSFWNELRIKADLLEQLRNANVPVLWRPYHELNGNWFWWGKQGPERFKKLWRIMFDYFVHERGLNNLIWVLCYTGDPDPAWYPGDEYVDIAGADTYDAGDGPQTNMFNDVKSIVSDKFPIAYHECGIPPNPDLCLAQNAMWSWWMEWHTTWLQGVNTDYLKKVYLHDLVLTRDELPDIMANYGWDSTCSPSAVLPFIKADSGAWLQSGKILEGSATNVAFYMKTSDDGSFSWTGYGTSGSDSIQIVPLGGPGSAMAVFTNTCGAITTVSFNITEACAVTPIDPYLQVNTTLWQNISNVAVNYGSTVNLAPRPSTGGSWSWSGAVTGTNREISLTPATSCSLLATYTNPCGKTSTKTFNITVNCPGTTITPYIKTGSGTFQMKSAASIIYGDTVILSPEPLTGGKWKWTGAVSDTIREVKFVPTATCSATAIFTNVCGSKTQKTFNLTVNCYPTVIEPYIKVNDGQLQHIETISISAGDSITISPSPLTDGSWLWSGAATGSTREIKLFPDTSCTIIAEYTNICNKKSQKTFTITVNQATGIPTSLQEKEIAVYPNPFNAFIIIENTAFSKSIPTDICLLSSNGSVVYNSVQRNNPETIDLSSVKPGLYLLRIMKGNLSHTKTIVKN